VLLGEILDPMSLMKPNILFISIWVKLQSYFSSRADLIYIHPPISFAIFLSLLLPTYLTHSQYLGTPPTQTLSTPI
jgi:hypothetical protein